MSEGWKRTFVSIGKVAYAIVVIPVVLWGMVFVFGASMKSYRYALIGSHEHNIAVIGSSSLGMRYALIQLGDRDRLSNVILEREELDRVLSMWDEARRHQAQRWSKIGDFTESDVINPSRLTISAGQGVRFAIVDASICVRYDLSPRDFQAFDQAAKRAKWHFTNDDADKGIDAGIFDLARCAGFDERGAKGIAPEWHSLARMPLGDQ